MDTEFFQCDSTISNITQCLNWIVKNNFRDIDAPKVYEALELAYSAHKTQVRSDNVPFMIHPMRVALMLVHFDRNITSKVFIAALLHDILEDTKVEKSVIEEQFGKYVFKLVQSVTRLHKTGDLQEKLQAKRQNWEEIILDDHEIRAIKTFEDLDNMMCWRTIPSQDPIQEKIPRWLEEARQMSLPLAYATNLQAYNMMQQERLYYVAKGYDSRPITK